MHVGFNFVVTDLVGGIAGSGLLEIAPCWQLPQLVVGGLLTDRRPTLYCLTVTITRVQPVVDLTFTLPADSPQQSNQLPEPSQMLHLPSY